VDLLGPGNIGWVRVAGGLLLIGYAGWVYVQPAEEETRERGPSRSAFLMSFATIFLLELADTTMIFEIVFVAEWGWLIVLVSGAAALITVAAWDVTLGSRLGARIRPQTLKKVVVTVLLVVGVVTIVYGLVPGAFPSFG
jgi:putative Ca2+/H+ antiporter (TMEM165/GDT1 family)